MTCRNDPSRKCGWKRIMSAQVCICRLPGESTSNDVNTETMPSSPDSTWNANMNIFKWYYRSGEREVKYSDGPYRIVTDQIYTHVRTYTFVENLAGRISWCGDRNFVGIFQPSVSVRDIEQERQNPHQFHWPPPSSKSKRLIWNQKENQRKWSIPPWDKRRTNPPVDATLTNT